MPLPGGLWLSMILCVCVCVCVHVCVSTGAHTHMQCMHFMQFMKHNLNNDLSKSLSVWIHVWVCCPPETITALLIGYQFSSVQFSHSVVSDSLWPYELQHPRPPCPSPTPGVHSDSHPLSWWCYPVISSSVVPFSSCPQSLPASEYFPMSQLFEWGGQSTGVSALASFFNTK